MEEKFKKFLSKYRLSKFRKSELIYQPGQVLNVARYIKSGYARLYSICTNGQEVTICLLKPMTLLPLFFSPTKIKSRYYLEALTAVEVWEVPKDDMVKFISANSDDLLEFMEGLTLFLRNLLRRVETLASGNAYSRVASTLLMLATETNKQAEKDVEILLPLTHRLVAEMTGLTRETVTLQIIKMKKKGIIASHGRRLAVPDLGKLRAAGCSPEE